jgi:LacI family transcriptional regulator
LMRRGAERIGFIGYDDSVYTIQQRILGYQEALDVHGLGGNSHVFRLKYHNDSSVRKIAEMVQDHQLDGLVCGTSHACYETISVLREHSIRIPKDTQIITFDESKWFEYLSFPISVVRQPTVEIGTLAVELIVNKLGTSSPVKRKPRKILLDYEIIDH